MSRKGYGLWIAAVSMIVFLVGFCRGGRSRTAEVLGIEIARPVADFTILSAKAQEAAYFVRTHEFETRYCLLADMSMHSGVRRMFVWDFDKDTIVRAFLVSHGCGSKVWSWDLTKDKPVFSNQDGSHCSSIGKYKIGKRGYSQWGIHVKYTLHGLEASNSNALGRAIVLHSWDEITDEEVFPDGTAEGWGCPAVSNSNMKYLDSCLSKSNRPVFLWMFAGRN